MIADTAKEGAGGLLGVLSLLESLRAPGGLNAWMHARSLAQTDPRQRPAVESSPFAAGYYMLGGQRVPGTELAGPSAPGGEGLAAPTPGRWRTNLSSPGPKQQVEAVASQEQLAAWQRIHGGGAASGDYTLVGLPVPLDVAQREAGSTGAAMKPYSYDPSRGMTFRAPQEKVGGSVASGVYKYEPGTDQATVLMPPQPRPSTKSDPATTPPKPFTEPWYIEQSALAKDKSLPADARAQAQQNVDAFKEAKADEAAIQKQASFDFSQLPATVQTTVSQVDTSAGIMERLMALLDGDPDVQAGRGIIKGRLENYIYQAGISQEPGKDAFQSLQAQVGVIGIQPFMRGVRRYEYLQDIRSHLPKPGDQLDLIKTKIREWTLLSLGMKRAALEWAGTQRKDIPARIKEIDDEQRKVEGGASGQGDGSIDLGGGFKLDIH